MTKMQIKKLTVHMDSVAHENSYKFTGRQIDDYCEKVLNLCLTAHPDGKLLFESVQIIKQLKGECPRYSKSHGDISWTFTYMPERCKIKQRIIFCFSVI